MKELLVPSMTLWLSVLIGCSSSTPAPECAEQPDPTKLSPAERAALDDSLARYGWRCKQQETQCQVRIVHTGAGDIVVTVASVFPHKESGQCVQAIGDEDLGVYGKDGAFVRAVPLL